MTYNNGAPVGGPVRAIVHGGEFIATESTPVPVSRYSYNGPKVLLAGAGLFVGGIAVAVLAGAVGCEVVWRYVQQRR